MRECDGHDGVRVQDPSGIRACYANGTWGNSHITYDPSPIDFVGSGGPTREWGHMPSYLILFELFWP